MSIYNIKELEYRIESLEIIMEKVYGCSPAVGKEKFQKWEKKFISDCKSSSRGKVDNYLQGYFDTIKEWKSLNNKLNKLKKNR